MKTKTIVEKRKSVTLKVVDDTLIIKRPFHVDDSLVEAFIHKKKPWIEKQLQLNQIFSIELDKPLVIFNQPITLEFRPNPKNMIIENDNHWVVYSKTNNSATRYVKNYLKLKLTDFILETLEELKQVKPFEYSEIQIKNLKGSWGNCKSSKQLTFAFRLIHMKESFVKSVVAHEVAHLFVMNHSPAFYRVLSQLDPNYHPSIKDQLDL